MKEIVKTSRLAGQLEKLFNKLNTDFFDGELTQPIITIQSTPRAYGHYTIQPVWGVKDSNRPEINIGAGTLDRPIEETVGVLLHEMCHQYNNEILNVQDCSGASRMYHNKYFKRTAESHGLIVTRSERYGWSTTTPADSLIEWLLENDVAEIKMNRNEGYGFRIAGGNAAANGGAAATGNTKGHYRRYVCPKCGMIARTTKDAKLICGECLAPMQES